jgi:hypothetical protein
MPNILDDYRHLEPLGSDQPEGPWFPIRARQLHTIARFAGDDEYATVRLEYRGAGYWEATRIDQDGNLTDETQMVYAEEPRG